MLRVLLFKKYSSSSVAHIFTEYSHIHPTRSLLRSRDFFLFFFFFCCWKHCIYYYQQLVNSIEVKSDNFFLDFKFKLFQVDGEENLQAAMSALALLSCRPNSHPFQERQISLHEAIKIGRSVARARPSASNGIFDCKVLSRHHAMLWYESGKVSETKFFKLFV